MTLGLLLFRIAHSQKSSHPSNSVLRLYLRTDMSKAVHSIAKEGDGVSYGDFPINDTVLQG
jgi:hypothetical protein